MSHLSYTIKVSKMKSLLSKKNIFCNKNPAKESYFSCLVLTSKKLHKIKLQVCCILCESTITKCMIYASFELSRYRCRYLLFVITITQTTWLANERLHWSGKKNTHFDRAIKMPWHAYPMIECTRTSHTRIQYNISEKRTKNHAR